MLSDEHLSVLASKVEVLNFQLGDVIIAEGHVGSLFGILVRGTMQISATGPTGKSIPICVQSPGFYFGESSIIGNTTTTASITALDDQVIVFALSRRVLQQVTVQMPEIRESLLKTVSYRLKQNLLAIPFFSQLRLKLEEKKIFKVLGAFDLLSTLFEVEAFEAKSLIFAAGSDATKFYVICEGCVRISSGRRGRAGNSDGEDMCLSMLKKNDVFGEIALLENTHRTATAKAFEPSLLLSITKEKFHKLFQVFPAFWEVMEPLLSHRTANTLKKVKIFAKLSVEKNEILGGMMEFKDFDAGQTIATEGSTDASMLVLVSGSVQATTTNKATGETVLLGVMEEGAVMGEMSLLTGQSRTANLIALERCLCLVLSAKKFRTFLAIAPEIMDDLIRVAQMRRKNSIVGDASSSLTIPDIDKDVENRLYLYKLLREQHQEGTDGIIDDSEFERLNETYENDSGRDSGQDASLREDGKWSEDGQYSYSPRNQKRSDSSFSPVRRRADSPPSKGGGPSPQPDRKTQKTLKKLKRDNDKMMQKNDIKKERINELKERIMELVEELETARARGGSSVGRDMKYSIDVDDELQSGKLPPTKLNTPMHSKNIQRRNSWQSNTTYEQCKEDLERLWNTIDSPGVDGEGVGGKRGKDDDDSGATENSNEDKEEDSDSFRSNKNKSEADKFEAEMMTKAKKPTAVTKSMSKEKSDSFAEQDSVAGSSTRNLDSIDIGSLSHLPTRRSSAPSPNIMLEKALSTEWSGASYAAKNDEETKERQAERFSERNSSNSRPGSGRSSRGNSRSGSTSGSRSNSRPGSSEQKSFNKPKIKYEKRSDPNVLGIEIEDVEGSSSRGVTVTGAGGSKEDSRGTPKLQSRSNSATSRISETVKNTIGSPSATLKGAIRRKSREISEDFEKSVGGGSPNFSVREAAGPTNTGGSEV